MGYIAVQGGSTAIENTAKLSKYLRIRGTSAPLSVWQIQDQMRYLVDRVMSEGSLYSPFHAALAVKQSEGDAIEAAFFLRAYRSTLRRIGYSNFLESDKMRITRRISSAFKKIPGGQILGATPDYSQRILDFSLLQESEASKTTDRERLKKVLQEAEELPGSFPKVADILRKQGLIANLKEEENDPTVVPKDITMEKVEFPESRAARLQMMARGETGGLLSIAYSSMRGFGSIHPTIAELRSGWVPVSIPHPYRKDEKITIGSVFITEVEIIAQFEASRDKEKKPHFTLGYGVSFGSNELKAISMAILDRTMRSQDHDHPAQSQEYVLLHTDGVESSGFCAHFKLPHYITFQSALDRLRAAQSKNVARSDKKTDRDQVKVDLMEKSNV